MPPPPCNPCGSLELRQYDHVTGQTARQPVAGSHLWLRANCNFDTEQARFSYSLDGRTFADLGPACTIVFGPTAAVARVAGR